MRVPTPVLIAIAWSRVVAAASDVPGDQEIVVHGALVPHASDPTAASTVVRGAELEAAGQSSADVLARVPGVTVQRTGAVSDLATASIRGSTSNQVPVYVAGIRVNDDVSGTADLSTIPLWMMDRVEVFRGNSPANADQLGIGGAIFFWPKLPKTTRAGAGVTVGSFGERGGFVTGEVGNDRAGALVAVRRTQADNDYGYVNDQGTRFVRGDLVQRRTNADFTQSDAWAVGRYRLSRTDSVTSVLNAFEREQGVTGYGVVPSDSTRATTRRLLSGVSGRFACPGARESCHVEVQGSLLVARATYTDPLERLPALRDPLTSNGGERATVRAAIETEASDALTLGAGITESVESIHIDRLELPRREGDRLASHLAANAVVTPLPDLRLFALAALDCHSTSGVTDQFGGLSRRDDGTCGVLEPAGRLGAAYRLSPAVELLANVGRYARSPTLAELYGVSAAVEGNGALNVETGETVDAGARITAGAGSARYALDTFAFARWASDLIAYRRVSDNAAAPYNVGNARVVGSETAASGEWFGALRLQASLTFMDSRDTTVTGAGNDIVPLVPRFVSALRLEGIARKGLSFLRQDRATLALVYLHRASRFADTAGEIELPEQDFVDVEATSAHFGQRAVLRLAVRNVFDSRQLDVLGLPLSGRSFHASVEAWF